MGNIAETIRKLRIARGLNQEQLADMIGVGRTAISNYEKGFRVPDLETAERLAEAFGISFGEFVDGYDLDSDSSKAGNTKEPSSDPNISELEFALSGEIHDLTEAEKQDVLDYVRFKRAQKSRQEAKP